MTNYRRTNNRYRLDTSKIAEDHVATSIAPSIMTDIDSILLTIKRSENTQQIRQSWQPTAESEIDIRIAANGKWFHQGREFKRLDLVRLFAGLLRKEANQYYLVTPAEKLRIEVEDAPFVASLVEQRELGGKSILSFMLNTEEPVIADNDHPIRVDTSTCNDEPRPYILVRNNLEALISRSAFFDLLMMAEETSINNKTHLTIKSRGQTFDLGSADNET